MYFYNKVSSNGLEMFFMLWTFVFVALFLYTNFNMMNMDGHSSTFFNFSKTSSSGKDRDKSSTGVFNLVKKEINVVYIVFILINVVAYFLVMPR